MKLHPIFKKVFIPYILSNMLQLSNPLSVMENWLLPNNKTVFEIPISLQNNI